MITLLTGGSACGKSSYAEETAVRLSRPLYYLAAMQPYGEGGAEKVMRHRKMRAGKGFETVERYRDYDSLELEKKGGTALLECICNLTANEMFDHEGNMRDPYERVLRGVKHISKQCSHLIIITNDVGSDIDMYSGGTREYILALGRINAALAAISDNVYELVAGIPIVIKGKLI